MGVSWNLSLTSRLAQRPLDIFPYMLYGRKSHPVKQFYYIVGLTLERAPNHFSLFSSRSDIISITSRIGNDVYNYLSTAGTYFNELIIKHGVLSRTLRVLLSQRVAFKTFPYWDSSETELLYVNAR